jgi:adhesin/invasin
VLTVTVRVTTSSGGVIAGAAVTFAVTSGGGSVASTSVATDDQGQASTGWTLGTTTGSNGLTATVAGVPSVTFTATGIPGPPTTVAVVAGDGQSARVGDPVTVPPAVAVQDRYHNPVPNVQVTFAVSAGGGTVAGAAPVTDAQGIARVGRWTLGLFSATHQLTATATGLPPVTFAAIGVSGWTYTNSGGFAIASRLAEEGSAGGTGLPWSATILRTAPELDVVCSSSGLVLLSLFDINLVTNSGAVAYSFDGGAAIGDLWEELSPDFDILFHPGPQSVTKAFISTLAASQTFRMAFQDFRGPTFVALFDVRGLSLELPRVMSTCP